MSDRASKALAEASLPGEPRTYDARSKRSGVPLTTLYLNLNDDATTRQLTWSGIPGRR